MTDEPRVERNEQLSRFELLLGDRVAGFADYVVDGDRVIFPHTEVDPALGGQGLGTVLAAKALATVKAEGKRIVAQCSFIALYVRRHADEYAAITDAT